MYHSFDIDIATEYGVNEAILLNYLYFWISKNKANEDNCYDGKYWTYNSITALCELFPYMSRKKIRGALDRLEEKGIIEKGNYNKVTYDRTIWYALTEKGWALFQKGKCIVPKGQMDCSEKANGLSQKGKPIPVNIPFNNTIILKEDNETLQCNNKVTRFIPPTIHEVDAYCRERGNNINAEAFIDFYESKGWMVGKNKMKDWKACVRTWEQRNKKSTNQSGFSDFPQREVDNDELERRLLRGRC
jgi:DNA-binding PadR family transcriptional regulator